MKKFALGLSAIALFLAGAAPAVPDSQVPLRRDPIVFAIQRLRPQLPTPKAAKLARAFRMASSTSGVPWQILVSIAHHESGLGRAMINARTGDYGLMQVNKKTALHYGLSQATLLKDDSSSLSVACRLIVENKANFSDTVPYWLGLYRSGTRLNDPRIRHNAQQYDRMIRLTAAKIGYVDGRRPKNYQR